MCRRDLPAREGSGRRGVPVAVTCRVLSLSRQRYSRWLKQPVSTTELLRAYRADALCTAHGEDPEFGYRFLVRSHGGGGQWLRCQRVLRPVPWAVTAASRRRS